MWEALLGAVVGGLIALFATWLTLRKQEERDERAHQRAQAAARADRLRAAYREVVAADEGWAGWSVGLALMALDAKRTRDHAQFLALLQERGRDIREVRAALLLEPEADQGVLEETSKLITQALAFMVKLSRMLTDEAELSSEEQQADLERMAATAKRVVALARRRLVEAEAGREQP